ncbi:cystatin-A2-like [Paramacrobiotus metropolitanus]|uniref:cystatin-A2-like n=1 Tax=Paramacrobiotus metropolitanus TaxID=2943436 RepID=UPI002446598D|nr:cystatin-A2-like [Paramacrobiotus metropolitanus]
MSRALLYLVSALLVVGFAAALEPKGGLGKPKEADKEVKDAVNAVSRQIISKARVSSNTILIPVLYSKQTVAGTNYFVKIRLGAGQGGQYIHAKIFWDLKGKYTLVSIKDANGPDPITFF